MRASITFALLVALVVVGQEAETFELSSILPWNWPIFHKASKSNATAPTETPMDKEMASLSSEPEVNKSTPKDPKPSNAAPANDAAKGAKVKRDLIYEYDGYD